MGKKYTYEEVKIYVNNLGYELISKEYINNKKLILKDIDGYYYFIILTNLQRGKIPDKFNIFNPYTINNIHNWIKINKKPYRLISDTYIGSSNNLQWKCLKEECGEEFGMCWSNIFQGQNCGYCSGHKVGLSNCLATKNQELASEWHPTKNGNLTPYDVTCGSGEYVWWKCKKCGHEWPATISSRNGKYKTGCPECNKSKGEKRIDEVLINNNWIKISQEEFNQLIDKNKYSKNYFIPQKEFDGLLGLGYKNLSYDHYIPRLNLLIEYDGEFHFKPIKYYKNEPMKYAEIRYKKQCIHDILKSKYAMDNNIDLLRIPYWEFNNIEDILNYYILRS